jgi:RsiW-degrading membrane proteinase PrsW (M82 family)
VTLPRGRAPAPPQAAEAFWLSEPAPAPASPASRIARLLLAGFLVVLMALSGLLILAAVTSDTGLVGFLIGVTLALLPLPVVLAAFRWVDRYEPEPRRLLAFAFFWGATVAALAAAVLNTATTMVVAAGSGSPGDGMATTAVFVAPWVEEGAKGLAVLAVFLFRRREFDGVVDGIVIAGLTGLGFAFTENILYFGRAFLAGSEDLGLSGGFFAVGLTFVLRGVLSPFAHPLFTVMTGIGFGVAARSPHAGVRWLAPLVGYLAAVLLHTAWNYSALGGLASFLTGYAVIMVPAFALVVAVALWSRRREGELVARWLPAYAHAGWLAPEDVAMLASLRARRLALAWARGAYGERGAPALQAFQHAATELAFLRDRAERGTAHEDFIQRERSLLADVARTRAAIHNPAGGR